MPNHVIKLADKLDFNVKVDGGANDAGVTYKMDKAFNHLATLNATTGELTPKAAGSLEVVAVLTADGTELTRFTVTILKSLQGQVVAQKKLDPNAVKTTKTKSPKTP